MPDMHDAFLEAIVFETLDADWNNATDCGRASCEAIARYLIANDDYLAPYPVAKIQPFVEAWFKLRL